MSVADKMLKEIVTLAKKLAVQEHENRSLWDSNMQIKQVRDLHAGRLREVEQELQRLRQRHVEVQSEDVAAARAETVEVRRRLNEEIGRHNATHAEKVEWFQQKQWADKHNAELIGERDAALATVDLQRAGIELQQKVIDVLEGKVESLQRFAEKIRMAHYCDNWPSIGMALDALDAGTSEPAPATEPKSNSSVTLTGSPEAEGQQ